jgi:hypothetical protein
MDVHIVSTAPSREVWNELLMTVIARPASDNQSTRCQQSKHSRLMVKAPEADRIPQLNQPYMFLVYIRAAQGL